MDTDLNVKIHTQGDVSIVDLSGDLDAFTCGKLRETIINLLDGGNRSLVICMSKVKYIDSSGLGTLVGGLRRISEQDGALALCGANPQIKKVFTITGLSRVFPLYENETEAISSLAN